MSDSDPEYEIGRGRPPKHTQYQPGQSGNPNGRPKKTKDPGELVQRELDQTVKIKENGTVKVITKRQVLIKTLVTKALNGDLRSLKMILEMDHQHASPEDFMSGRKTEAILIDYLNQFPPNSGGDDGSED